MCVRARHVQVRMPQILFFWAFPSAFFSFLTTDDACACPPERRNSHAPLAYAWANQHVRNFKFLIGRPLPDMRANKAHALRHHVRHFRSFLLCTQTRSLHIVVIRICTVVPSALYFIVTCGACLMSCQNARANANPWQFVMSTLQ